MQRKGICRHFLIIGISILLLVSGSCNPQIEWIETNSYRYINHSGKSLQMMIYNSADELISDNEIVDGDTLTFTRKTVGGWLPFHFYTDVDSVGDSIYLNFANERYTVYHTNQTGSIFHVKAYTEVKVAERNTHYYWEFTPDDYENATPN